MLWSVSKWFYSRPTKDMTEALILPGISITLLKSTIMIFLLYNCILYNPESMVRHGTREGCWQTNRIVLMISRVQQNILYRTNTHKLKGNHSNWTNKWCMRCHNLWLAYYSFALWTSIWHSNLALQYSIWHSHHWF